jgi:glyoxylase-like metal-dependent hydrolase (beta-lactamase superfamily II)
MSTIQVGDVTITRVQEWKDHLFYRSELLPESTREAWEANQSWLVPEFWSRATDDAWLCSQPFVVRSAGRTIVVDTGIGNDKRRPSIPPFNDLHTDFLDRLTANGAAPGDVDLVVCTHLHPDHIGWNTRLVDGEWVPTFPHARYLLPQADFDWLSEASRSADQKDPSGFIGAFEDSVVPIAKAGQAEFWRDEYAIDDALRLSSVPGHTPGAAVLLITSDGQHAVLAGDIVHHPMQILDPDQRDMTDADQPLATASRRRILGWAADNQAALLPAHFPTDRAARIARRGGDFAIDGWTALV